LRAATLAGFAAVLVVSHAEAQQQPKDVTIGPKTIPLGLNVGDLKLPKGFVFIGKETARQIEEEQGNKDDSVLGIVQPAEEEWGAILRYKDVGYVRDSEADKMNADSMLEDYREGTKQQNEARKEAGDTEEQMEVVGWYKPPVYNRSTHTLSWAIIGRSMPSGHEVINCNSLVFGRHGYFETIVVGDNKQAAALGPKLGVLGSMTNFRRGEDYASFKRGDRVSDLTMAGLVTGGAAAAAYGAAKVGLLGKLGKLLLVIALALKKAVVLVIAVVAGGVKALWAKVTGRGKPPEVVAADGPNPPDVPTV
jgi:uncharacterized membrane-anchored protein